MLCHMETWGLTPIQLMVYNQDYQNAPYCQVEDYPKEKGKLFTNAVSIQIVQIKGMYIGIINKRKPKKQFSVEKKAQCQNCQKADCSKNLLSLYSCSHTFCLPCLEKHFMSTSLKDNAKKIKCLNPKCQETYDI